MRQIALDKGEGHIAALHLLDQCTWLGPDRGCFQRVFDFRDIGAVHRFCEDEVFALPLPRFHARNAAQLDLAPLDLTRAQRQRVVRAYAADYEAGWGQDQHPASTLCRAGATAPATSARRR